MPHLPYEHATRSAHLDNAVRDALFLAERRKPHDKFYGVHVMRNDYQLSFASLHKRGDMVEAKFYHHGFLLVSILHTLFAFGVTRDNDSLNVDSFLLYS
jgi:hypothetical protein